MDILKDKVEHEVADGISAALVPEACQPAGLSERSWAELVADQGINQVELQLRLDEFIRITRDWIENAERQRSKRRRRLIEKLAEEWQDQEKH